MNIKDIAGQIVQIVGGIIIAYGICTSIWAHVSANFTKKKWNDQRRQ